MSVIGIDLGSESCYIAVARAGGIETIANDYSLRATPSCIAFGDKQRILGVAAKNQQITNMKNTIYGFRQLLGKKYSHPDLKNEIEKFPFTVKKLANDAIGIEVQYLNKQVVFTPEQITGMLLTKLKETAEIALKIKVTDCVISVPAHFTDSERRAILAATQIAELNVLRLLNDTTAAALCYGIYKQDLPAPEEKARNVIFVDMGFSTLQVSAVAFNKGKLKVLATVSSAELGGRYIDEKLAQHFNEEFKSRFKVNANGNQRAYLRLLQEVEKLKKQMSANSTVLPLAIECFMDDKDVSGRMKRTEMEDLITDFLTAAESLFMQLLQDCRLQKDDIYAVELVGGSTRVPAIKNLIQKIFDKEPSTTLNQDEAVARGCALQCAMLSPNFKVRDFAITDAQMYPILLSWGEMDEDGSDVVFTKNHPVPFSKQLTFFRRNPFKLEAYYKDIPLQDKLIGKFMINNVAPTADGSSAKVKVKVRVNIHGIFNVSSAVLLEPKDNTKDEEPMQVDQNAADETPNSANENDKMDTDKNEDSNGKKESPANKKVKTLKQVELPIERVVNEVSLNQLNLYIEDEGKMIASDKLEKERIDAKNAVEEYVYEMRDKLSDQLAPYILEKDKEIFSTLLSNTETWLYEDGEDELKHLYVVKLEELKKYGEPVKKRRMEFEERPKSLEELGKAIQLTRKALDSYAQGEETYNHIESQKMTDVNNAVVEAQRRYDEAARTCELYENLPVSIDDIKKAKQVLEQIVKPILNTPKPKADPPPEEQATKEPPKTEEATKGPDGGDAKMDFETNN